jgi:hypothetical protein
MPVDSIFWSRGNGADFHLLPGLSSPRLDQLLWINHDGSKLPVRADRPPGGVAVTFGTTFVPGAAGTRGVEVDGLTGAVTVTSPLSPHPRLLDFLVIAFVVDGVHAPFNAHIRFHIHTGLTKMWLTPAQLTVRDAARNCRFSGLAEFTDGTYGDVSNWSPWDEPAPQDLTFVHFSGSNAPLVTWGSSAPTTMGVRPHTGRLTCTSAAASADIQALTPLIAGVASGRAVGAPPWSTAVPLTPVPGEGFLPPDSTPNILILSDGFPAAEEQDFIKLARLLVTRLQTEQRTNPFNLLKDRMNYFAAFVQSPKSGISALSPVERTPVPGGDAKAVEVDVAIPPAAAAGTPPNIAVPPRPETTTRFLLNELDTAFGAVLGERPHAQRIQEIRVAYLSPRRFDEADFDEFLATLRDPDGGDVGKHWIRGGKDEVAVLVLCRTDHYGGGNMRRSETGAIICLPLGVEEVFHMTPATGAPGHDLVADPIPAEVHIELRTRAAHELAHSFTLGDEYGGGGELPPSEEERVERYANVQARKPKLPGGRGLVNAADQLDADLIKWRWPRLVHAAKLKSQPVPSGAGHRLLFIAGDATNFPTKLQATDFPEHSILRLRTHPLPKSVASYRLRVMRVAGNSEVYVEPAEPIPAGTPPLADTFRAGSIVMDPKRAPDQPGGLGDDLELVHADVRRWIGSTSTGQGHDNPLNADSLAGPNRPCPGPEPKRDAKGKLLPSTPARNYPMGAAPNPPEQSAWITGLFEMGAGFDCGVYHPTGACIMGVHAFDEGASSFQFCWVCRYAMVDFVDPSLHGQVDADYAYRYPL